ncbi:MAG: FHA domain-containing protein [Streptosporangiaceae bacterium]
MGGSAADTPTTPEFLRASDAERDHAVDELKKEFVDGRLSHETFIYRMQSALGAKNHGQLAHLFADLPPRRPHLLARVWAYLCGRRPDEPDPMPMPAMPQGPYGIPAPGFPATHLAAPGYPGMAGHGGGHRWHGPPGPPGPPGAPGPPESGGSGQPGVPMPLFFPPGSGTSFTIGRTQECDLRIADLSVSRLHARLVRVEDGWLLRDLGSHNGTRVNGWLIREPVPVRAGDRVEFGSALFVITEPVIRPVPVVQSAPVTGPFAQGGPVVPPGPIAQGGPVVPAGPADQPEPVSPVIQIGPVDPALPE